jgi:hypothetical protein
VDDADVDDDGQIDYTFADAAIYGAVCSHASSDTWHAARRTSGFW